MTGRGDDRFDGGRRGGPVYRRRFDVSKRRAISLAIIEAVETVLDEPERARHSLHEIIDPDAIDMLFRPRRNGLPRVNGTVKFPFAEYEVVVDAAGLIEIYRRDDAVG